MYVKTLVLLLLVLLFYCFLMFVYFFTMAKFYDFIICLFGEEYVVLYSFTVCFIVNLCCTILLVLVIWAHFHLKERTIDTYIFYFIYITLPNQISQFLSLISLIINFFCSYYLLIKKGICGVTQVFSLLPFVFLSVPPHYSVAVQNRISSFYHSGSQRGSNYFSAPDFVSDPKKFEEQIIFDKIGGSYIKQFCLTNAEMQEHLNISPSKAAFFQQVDRRDVGNLYNNILTRARFLSRASEQRFWVPEQHRFALSSPSSVIDIHFFENLYKINRLFWLRKSNASLNVNTLSLNTFEWIAQDRITRNAKFFLTHKNDLEENLISLATCYETLRDFVFEHEAQVKILIDSCIKFDEDSTTLSPKKLLRLIDWGNEETVDKIKIFLQADMKLRLPRNVTKTDIKAILLDSGREQICRAIKKVHFVEKYLDETHLSIAPTFSHVLDRRFKPLLDETRRYFPYEDFVQQSTLELIEKIPCFVPDFMLDSAKIPAGFDSSVYPRHSLFFLNRESELVVNKDFLVLKSDPQFTNFLQNLLQPLPRNIEAQSWLETSDPRKWSQLCGTYLRAIPDKPTEILDLVPPELPALFFEKPPKINRFFDSQFRHHLFLQNPSVNLEHKLVYRDIVEIVAGFFN